MAIMVLRDVRKTFTRSRRTGLRWRRTEVSAVSGVSFEVQPGEMVGYLGPNGAGKSTTIKMLTGILTPTSGSVTVLDMEPSRQRLRLAKNIGAVFGQRSTLWWDLPLADSFSALRRIYDVDSGTHQRNLDEFIQRLDLAALLQIPVRQLSLGQRMRGELTAALLHNPSVVFLDEPTIGLDVVSKSAVREFLTDVNRQRGTTVVLTTHDLDDVERLCQRVILIDHGQVVHDGSLATLRSASTRKRLLVVDLVAPAGAIEVAGATVVSVDGPRQWLELETDTAAAPVIAAIAARDDLADVSLQDPSVEDIVADIYRRSIT
jgi:ABC-2 type transport system ATP-binding protein